MALRSGAGRTTRSSTSPTGPGPGRSIGAGSGPAVIVIHEMPGLHPLVVRFADRVAAAGMTVFCPSLFGEPGRPVDRGYALRTMLSAHLHPPGVPRLGDRQLQPDRRLAARAGPPGPRGVRRQGRRRGRHVLHRRLRAGDDDRARRGGAGAVAALPAAAAGLERSAPPAIGASPAEIACAKAPVRGRGPVDDRPALPRRPLVPDARFETYRREFGDRFEAIELDDEDAAPARSCRRTRC